MCQEGRSRQELRNKINVAFRRLLLAGNGTENPKLLRLVFPRNGMYLITPCVYLIEHTHASSPPFARNYTKFPAAHAICAALIRGYSYAKTVVRLYTQSARVIV